EAAHATFTERDDETALREAAYALTLWREQLPARRQEMAAEVREVARLQSELDRLADVPVRAAGLEEAERRHEQALLLRERTRLEVERCEQHLADFRQGDGRCPIFALPCSTIKNGAVEKLTADAHAAKARARAA